MAPRNVWSSKDERQYEHVKESMEEAGRSSDRAGEIAARTVNAQRQKEGRTENRTTMGTGNPNSSLESRSRAQLLNRARQLDIRGRSSMRKSELVSAIRAAQD